MQDLCGQVGGIEDFTSLLNVTETPTHNRKVLFYVNGTSEKPLLKKKKKKLKQANSKTVSYPFHTKITADF